MRRDLSARGRAVAVFAIVSLLTTFAYDLPAKAKPYQSPAGQKEPAVAGRSFNPTAAAVSSSAAAFGAAAPVWPQQLSAQIQLGMATARAEGESAVAVPGLPVRLEPASASATTTARGKAASAINVESLGRAQSQAFGVTGALFRLSAVDGDSASVRMTVDYNAFRWAYGADWASRLRLRTFDGTVLETVNNFGAGTVSADVAVTARTVTTFAQHGFTETGEPQPNLVTGGTMVALDAGSSGAGGDHKASPLNPSATWSAGGNSGDFTWSYPIRVPPSLGGPAPDIELAYSSASVDGKMAAGNNQASWIGEGFDWNPGYIERRYTTCAEDMTGENNNTEKTGDLCWETDNASVVTSDQAGDLLRNASDANRYHLRSDDGTKFERRLNGPHKGGPTGDEDGEWWVMTATDGTEYWFGGRAGSNSVLTVPVFGNHPGEPCKATAFKDSACVQAYKWYLDQVVDRFGNTMKFTYVKETNKYGKNNKREDDTVYDRDGYLEKIEYGTRNGVSATAPMLIEFGVNDRCFSDCHLKDAAHWPDIPTDQECAADTCALSQNAPTFWSKKRLTSIKTRVRGPLGLYHDVEQWTFAHSFPVSDQPALWLERISHTGLVGGSKTVPDLTLVGEQRSNRVDTNNDQYPAMMRYRLKTITAETGGKIDVTYSGPDCVKGSRMPDKDNLHLNTLRCYPVKWTPEGQTKDIDDFFHKYVVSDVVEADLSGNSSRVLTHYDYQGDPAWHYTDDDGFIKKSHKTWSVWRGYEYVQTIKGDPGEQTKEKRRYFRGMHGDKLPSGTRNVVLPAIAVGAVPAVNDEDAFQGMPRETIVYNGPSGAEVSATAEVPWQSAHTASRTINEHTVYARMTGTTSSHSRTVLDGGRGYRTTSSRTTNDSYGMPIRVEDRGDDAVTGDEQCTITDYVRNSGSWILETVSREREFATDCTRAQGTGLTEAEIISDTRTSYDGLAWNAAPTKGTATKTETLKSWAGGTPTYVTASRITYDVHGRTVESWDTLGNRTQTSYTPQFDGPVTSSKETSPLGWTKDVTYEPAWAQPVTTTDANGRKITLGYDPLGRLTGVWLPGRDSVGQSANIVYDYLIRNNAPSVVTTKRLNPSGGYVTSYQFYDNMLRLRQTQESDGAGGASAVVTDTYYDSAGRIVKTHDPYVAKNAQNQPVPPSTNLFLPSGNIPALHVKNYDGAGQEIADIFKVDGPPASPGGTVKWSTITSYGGDRVHVTPPPGDTASTVIKDASDNTVATLHYHAGVPAGSASGFDPTSYRYNNKDELVEVRDATGSVWTYQYDLRGNQTRAVDPDKGEVLTNYNDLGEVTSTRDGRGVWISYRRDAIGRKLSSHDGPTTAGPMRAQWVYDTLSNGTPVKGHLVKTIRYEGAAEYIKEHVTYNADYRPTAVKYTIPDTTTARGVNGTYSYVYSFNQDGSQATTRLPAMGDLGAENLTTGYDSLGRESTLDTSLGATLVAKPNVTTPGTEYTSYGELAAIHLQHNAGARADIVRTYNTQTRRLEQIWTTRATAPTTVADVRFSYDESGNVTAISDLTGNDHQCFKTDYLRRLKEAWTQANAGCAATPAAGLVGGAAKYWHTYNYDATGSRTTSVEHGTSAGERTTGYTVPGGAHRLTGTSTTDSAGTRNATYGYDGSGNMTSRPAPGGGTQTMTWDAEGHLATSTDSTGTTSFIYDVDGERLLRKDPAGVTLYLPGQELRYTNAGQTPKCTRYYTHADQTIAVRSASGLVWLSGDHHETAQIAINAVGQAVSLRRETPFGEDRSSTGTWPAAMDKGFVGGTKDNTGLTHLGAREYDPKIGRFISVDPMIDDEDPQQMHGYSYANNAPVTASDADGLWPKFLDKAVNKVSNAVSSATSSVVSGVKAAGNWVYDNAGTISTVLAVAAIACTVIPPLQVAAPILGAAATAVGAIDTYKSCKSGAGLDCALGIAELVPGGRAVGAVGDGAKAAKKAAGKADDAAAARKGTKGCHSFRPTTRVAMAGGDTKEIGDIEIGDQVVATDPQTGQTAAKPVTALFHNLDRDLTDLQVMIDPDPLVTGDESTETIETTWHHPFWDLTSASWVDAADLAAGHGLLTLDGTEATVVVVHNYVGSQIMRDLTVADLHTYYVLAAQTPLLVHNNNGDVCEVPGGQPDPPKPQPSKLQKFRDNMKQHMDGVAGGYGAADDFGPILGLLGLLKPGAQYVAQFFVTFWSYFKRVDTLRAPKAKANSSTRGARNKHKHHNKYTKKNRTSGNKKSDNNRLANDQFNAHKKNLM